MSHVLRRAATVVAALALGVASAATATTAAAAETGLSGVVVDDLGAPVSTCVQAYQTDWTYIESACTDEAGAWALPAVPDGDYKIYVPGDAYRSGEWFDDAVEFDTATVVSAPATLATTLQVGGLLEGSLTDADGNPVTWTNVYVVDASGEVVANTATYDTGQWRVLVPPGDYKVHFWGYPVNQWAFGAADASSASILTVVAGETTLVNDQLPNFTSVSGTITDDSGRPLSNICASAVNPEAFAPYEAFGYACSDAEGHYELIPWGEAASATVWFEDTNEPRVYAAEFAGDTYDVTAAQRIDFTGDDVVVDVTLSVGGVITGKAVTERKPKGLADVCPQAYAGRTGGLVWGTGTECSGTDGVYRVSALPPGATSVLLQPSWRTGVSAEWYHDASSQATSTLTTVTLGSSTTLKPNKFVPGGVLTGTVTDPAGQPVEGAWVYLEGQYPGRAGPGEGRFVAQTDSAGRYSLVAPAGTYTPLVDPPFGTGLAPEWSGDAVTSATAAPVTMQNFRSTTFDVRLVPASHLTGEVLGADGQPTSMEGQIFTTSGDYIGDWFAFPENGYPITTSPLPAGSFVLNGWIFENGEDPPTTTWYDGATLREDATPVSLTVGETKEITYHLP